MSTIFALATTPGRSAIAVVRVSGPGTRRAMERLVGHVPPPRRASLRTLRDPTSSEVLDQALVLWFPAPHSFTGEDQAELHLHGSNAIVSATFAAMAAEGLQLAQPGEFTRRAFENGKIDLAQAEAVADLVDAETEAQRRQALSQLGGALTDVQDRWRGKLISIVALTEAAIDFADESLPDGLMGTAREELDQLKHELLGAISDSRGEQVRDGFCIAIIGEPNAGKSTLINAIAARDVAIVTPTPGTTRDVVEVWLVVNGYSVRIADTAGIRSPADEVEAEGIRRAHKLANAADLRLYVVDQSQATFDHRSMASVLSGDVLVVNKEDLPLGRGGEAALAWARSHDVQVQKCSAIGGSVVALIEVIATTVAERLGGFEPPVATRARHREQLTLAASHIDRAMSAVIEPELFAENVRLAIRSLERITGRVDTEQVLDQIFGAFCIGK